MSIVNCLYRGTCDLDAILNLFTTFRPRSRLADYPSAADLLALLSMAEVQRRTRLWFDQRGQFARYAFVDELCNLCWEDKGSSGFLTPQPTAADRWPGRADRRSGRWRPG